MGTRAWFGWRVSLHENSILSLILSCSGDCVIGNGDFHWMVLHGNLTTRTPTPFPTFESLDLWTHQKVPCKHIKVTAHNNSLIIGDTVWTAQVNPFSRLDAELVHFEQPTPKRMSPSPSSCWTPNKAVCMGNRRPSSGHRPHLDPTQQPTRLYKLFIMYSSGGLKSESLFARRLSSDWRAMLEAVRGGWKQRNALAARHFAAMCFVSPRRQSGKSSWENGALYPLSEPSKDAKRRKKCAKGIISPREVSVCDSKWKILSCASW